MLVAWYKPCGAVRGAHVSPPQNVNHRSCFDAFADQLVSRLIVQVVRVATGAELDLVGAFGGQHICSGLDNQGMTHRSGRGNGVVEYMPRLTRRNDNGINNRSSSCGAYASESDTTNHESQSALECESISAALFRRACRWLGACQTPTSRSTNGRVCRCSSCSSNFPVSECGSFFFAFSFKPNKPSSQYLQTYTTTAN